MCILEYREGLPTFHPFIYQKEYSPNSTQVSHFYCKSHVSLIRWNVISRRVYLFPTSLAFPLPEEGFAFKTPGLLPYLYPSPRTRSKWSVWWNWKRNQACTIHLLPPSILLGAAFLQSMDICFCWKALALQQGGCLTLCFNIRKPAGGQIWATFSTSN